MKEHQHRIRAVTARGHMPRALGSLRWILPFALLPFVAGCTHVKPWQRGALADVTMRPDRDPLGTRFADHVYFSREASTGGRGVGGGGCGCN